MIQKIREVEIMDRNRLERGAERLEQMRHNSGICSRLDEVSPELSRYIREFAFGDVHSREGLFARDHELVIIAGICYPAKLNTFEITSTNKTCTRRDFVISHSSSYQLKQGGSRI